MAVGNASAESLLALVPERIEDEPDRVVVFAVVALEMPASRLARELQLDRREGEAGLK